MKLGPGVRGHGTQGERPDWQPLLALAPDHIDDFMWMFEVRLDDGRSVHAYKHIDTRTYVHLGEDGQAFCYGEDAWYHPVGAEELLALAVAPGR